MIGSTPNDNILGAEVVPIKYLINFWRSLNFPLINCEIELYLSWSRQCIMSEISIIPRIYPNPDANPHVCEMAAIQINGASFQIKNAKLYVPVVTMSINDNIKFV